MASLALGFCLIAAIAYSAEMVSQERTLPRVSPIVVTGLFGFGVGLYGMPCVMLEMWSGSIKWPSGWEWLLLFILPLLAFMADWAHFTAIHARAGSIPLATMYMGIPMFASVLRLEQPTVSRFASWLLTGLSIVILIRARLFIEGDEPKSGTSTRSTALLAATASVLATFLYAAEVVAQDVYLSHISFTVLAMVGGFATAFYAGLVLTISRPDTRKKLQWPQRKEWRYVLIIPVISYLADLGHFGALHLKAGSITLAMFYMTCPIWASGMAENKPTQWHVLAWFFAALGLMLLIF